MDIEEQIIDKDGSCRDINFPDVNESQAIALLAYVQASCKLSGASDSEGNELAITEISDRLSSSDSETIVSGWVCHK